jgi:DedD protein
VKVPGFSRGRLTNQEPAMRYTSEATMDDRALRDVERWKDKIEVRLDNRQVFFLFFGSALVACLLFILGVIVGKRLESRGRAVAPEIEDPLALLDKVATAPRPGPEPAPALPRVLFGASATAPRPVPASKAAAPAKTPPAIEVHAAKAALPAAKPEAVKPALAKPEAAKPVAAKPEVAKPVAAKPEAAKPVAAKAEPAKPVAAAPKAEPKPVVTPPAKKVALAALPAAADASKGAKGHFTLQLGSFPDRAEAEAFSQRFSGQGSYVISSEIPGKGTWFRVRVGDYGNAKDAIAAKAAFEKQHSVIAYVVGPTH